MKNESVAQSVIKSLAYDEETGILTWKIKKNGIRKNRVAGTMFTCERTKTQYLRIRVNGKAYMAHRIAWLIITGEWPESLLDHINGNGLDNRKENLREVSIATNAKNARLSSRNTTGTTGVYCINNQWKAFVRVDYRLIPLGSFQTKADAIAARKQAESRYGFHENHGRTRNSD